MAWKKVVLRGDNATDEQLTLTEASIDVASDSIAFVDGDGFIKKDTIADFTSGIAGTNISASSGQLSVGTATSAALGVVKLFSNTVAGTAESVSTATNRTYGVQLNSDSQMVVNVPWTDTSSLTEEQVEDIVGGMLGGTETGISVTYNDGAGSGDGTINFVVADQTLESSDDGSGNVVLTMSNPGTDDTVTLTAGTGITFSSIDTGGFTISSSSAAGTVTVADASTTDADHYLVFTSSALGGNAELKADTNFKWNPVDDTLTVQNLVVSGTQTTVNTTSLVVSDKNIVLADGAANGSAADGAGITIDIADAVDAMPQFLWNNGGSLAGWTVSDYDGTTNTDFPVAVMEFGSAASTAPAGNAAGVGSFHFNTTDQNLYIRTS